MTEFDWIVAAVVLASTLFAFWRGAIRVVVSLASWLIGLFAAIHWAAPFAGWLPDFAHSGVARYLAAFLLILFGVLIVGAVIGLVLARAVRAIGLGFLDRLLGGLLGIARGVLIVIVFVLIAGVTTVPRQDWWQNAALSGPLAVAALSLRPWLPRAWAERLDYGPSERRGRRDVPPAAERPTLQVRGHAARAPRA